ncbi:uncharacterized protein EI97DRAFT_456248 [Westerdykella ornata]|uniref:Uncharacterized protein n=1 Tax=Westerdykella ornata TaxID=318751 RepID=A0A6A6JSU0_WESOR|nr:uncharacterized protein EI97DRAFT_456248 [Westerdykella ornata]KAF2278806.1 hypothetical protein EI97DRAFT_456248 [Westerdykella ornata]
MTVGDRDQVVRSFRAPIPAWSTPGPNVSGMDTEVPVLSYYMSSGMNLHDHCHNVHGTFNTRQLITALSNAMVGIGAEIFAEGKDTEDYDDHGRSWTDEDLKGFVFHEGMVYPRDEAPEEALNQGKTPTRAEFVLGIVNAGGPRDVRLDVHGDGAVSVAAPLFNTKEKLELDTPKEAKKVTRYSKKARQNIVPDEPAIAAFKDTTDRKSKAAKGADDETDAEDGRQGTPTPMQLQPSQTPWLALVRRFLRREMRRLCSWIGVG